MPTRSSGVWGDRRATPRGPKPRVPQTSRVRSEDGAGAWSIPATVGPIQTPVTHQPALSCPGYFWKFLCYPVNFQIGKYLYFPQYVTSHLAGNFFTLKESQHGQRQ